MRKLIITLAALLLCGAAYTQVELPYSQIINNPSWINPAYVGINKGATLDLAYKRQWEGFDGAPKTIGFNIHNSFDKIRLGVGIDGHFEEVGHRNANRIGLNLKTMVNITETSELMFGLSLGLDMRRYKSSATSQISGTTSSHVFDDKNNFMGGFGVNYKWKDLQVGASAQMVFMQEDGLADNIDGTDNATFVNLHAEYNLQLAPDWSLKPMALYR